MTAYLDMNAANRYVAELYQPAVDRFMEEERELARRLEPIGPLPSWWRPFARRRWREAATKIHHGWAMWCMSRAMETSK